MEDIARGAAPVAAVRLSQGLGNDFLSDDLPAGLPSAGSEYAPSSPLVAGST